MANRLAVIVALIAVCRGTSSLPPDQRISSVSIEFKGADTVESREESRQNSCWELMVDGRRLHPQFIVRSVHAATLRDCQKECEDVLFNCETIAFGKNLLKNTTCDLSDWEAATLSFQPFATDTIQADTFNIYSRYGRYPNEPQDERRCNQISDTETISSSHRPLPAKFQQLVISEDVCYSVVFTGRRLSHRYIERSVAVISLEECKLLCTRETSFDCRSFNYRRRLSSTNCDLSREDSASLDVTSSRVFISDPDVDFYQRVGKGQGCYRPYNHPRPPVTSIPSTNEYYYGGSHLATAISSQRPTSQQPATSINECYRRLKSGYRLEPRVVRDSLTVRALFECQIECHRSRVFVCRSFSYRQSPSGYNVNNCELSDLDPREWDPVRHLVVDREADVYERSLVGRQCRDSPFTTWNNNRPIITSVAKPPPHLQNTLCFLRTKSGVRLDRRAVRYTITANSPVECERECINAQYFTCRSFSYRFSHSPSLTDSYHKTYDNCDLSDVDLNSLDPVRDLIDDRLYDSWQRTSYSRDCDIGTYRLPDTSGDGYVNRDDDHLYTSLNPWFHYNQQPYPLLTSWTSSRCYISYRRGFRMVQRHVRDSIHVRNLAECELECSRTRPFTCQTFHFRYTNLDGGYDRNPYNCELSEVSARDFDRFRDMTDDRDYELFTRSQFSSCNQGLNGNELSPILASSSSEVTVSGFRCRPGSRCRPHRELGYWYCEISEHNNYNNNWDYCCQPQSRCGYSDGFSYPWCYVGTEASGQWRPCSDRYADRPYAYLHRNSPPNNGTETIGQTLFKNDDDVIQPIDSNSADLTRSNWTPRIMVKSNCTTTEATPHLDVDVSSD